MLVSIIVPVYNSEKFLKSCVDSILKQTYRNLELILVDDGSTDSSPQICDDYKSQDSRVVVIHKPNGGISNARNKGIEIAKGEYLTFVDNDDYLPPKALEAYVDCINKTHANVVQGDVLFQLISEPLHREKIIDDEKDEYIIENPCDFLKKNSVNKTYVWSKLYKTEIARSHHFPEGRFGEDLYFNGLFFSDNRIDRVATIKSTVYVHYDNGESASHSWKPDDYIEIYLAIKQLYEKVKNNTDNSQIVLIYLSLVFTHYACWKYNLIIRNLYQEEKKFFFVKERPLILKEMWSSGFSLAKKVLYTCLVYSNEAYRRYIFHKDPTMKKYENEVKNGN